MTMFNSGRRSALKGLSAFGMMGILGGCNSDDGSSPGTTSDTTLRLDNGLTLGGTNNTAEGIIIDASVEATGIPAGYPIYAYITGLVNGIFYRYDPEQQKPVPMLINDPGNNKKTGDTGLSGGTYNSNYPSPWADYSIPLDRSAATVVASLSSFNGANIPGFGKGEFAFSGRIWISVGKPLIPFSPHENPDKKGSVSGYATPVVFSSGPGGLCFYDWLEFSFASDKELYINTTQVDQYGFSISVDATGETVRTEPQGLYKKNRSVILKELAEDQDKHPEAGSLFSTVVAIPSAINEVDPMAYPPFENTKNILRALAPSSTFTPESKPDYLDEVIETALNSWKESWLEITCSSNALQATYYGLTDASGKTLNFYKDRSLGTVQFCFDNFNTKNILECDDSIQGISKTQPTGPLLTDFRNTGKALLAGFNRGVITATTRKLNIDTDDQGNQNFAPPLDQNYADPSVRYNRWARQFHDFSQNGKAYGFAYDDVGNEEPMFVALGTTSINIKLGKFT